MTASTRSSETGLVARTSRAVTVAADVEAEVITEAAVATAGDAAKAAVATLAVADETVEIRRGPFTVSPRPDGSKAHESFCSPGGPGEAPGPTCLGGDLTAVACTKALLPPEGGAEGGSFQRKKHLATWSLVFQAALELAFLPALAWLLYDDTRLALAWVLVTSV